MNLMIVVQICGFLVFFTLWYVTKFGVDISVFIFRIVAIITYIFVLERAWFVIGACNTPYTLDLYFMNKVKNWQIPFIFIKCVYKLLQQWNEINSEQMLEHTASNHISVAAHSHL